MTWQSGGGGGIAGVTPDGLTPAGIAIAGAIQAGEPNALVDVIFNVIYGNFEVFDTPAINDDGDDVVQLTQNKNLGASSDAQSVLRIQRSGNISTKDYQAPTAHINDLTNSAQAGLRVDKHLGTGLCVLVNGKLASTQAVTHTLGAYSGKSLPLYDDTNTLLGYLPIYA